MCNLQWLNDLKFALVDEAAIPIETRPVYYEAAGDFLETPVYLGADLYHGHSFSGPAIIEEVTTTILVGPGDCVTVDDLNNYVVTFETGG